MMKRNVAIWALAALFGGAASAADNPQLGYVPADTHLYIGTGKPYPIDALIAAMPNIPMPDAAELEDEEEGFKDFVKAYEGFLEDPAKVLADWGIEEELSFSLYTVGIAPVLRVAVSDGDKLLAKIDELGDSDDVNVSEIQREGGSYRLYDPKDEDVPFALMVGVGEKDAVFGVALDAENLAATDQLAGFVAPEKSIASTGRLGELREKWDYGDDFFSFIDFRQIAATITQPDGESGKQLQALLEREPDAAAALAEMRKPVCREEISGIADVWPMLVGGYRDLVIEADRVSGVSHMAMEINHQQLSDTLQLFGGVIPGLGHGADAMLSVGLGLDVNKLSQGFGQLSQLMSSVSYQCAPLQGLNGGGEALSGASMGVVMFSGMARGIRGISASIFDLDLDVEQLQRGQPGLDKADLAIAISADDPATLLQTLQMMPQMNGLGAIPLDGTSVALSEIAPLPLPPEFDAEVAVKGKNVVLFRGDKAGKFSTALESEPAEEQSLLFNMLIDTESVIAKVKSVVDEMDIDTSDEETRIMLDVMEGYPLGSMDLTFDFTPNGVEYLTNFDFDLSR